MSETCTVSTIVPTSSVIRSLLPSSTSAAAEGLQSPRGPDRTLLTSASAAW